MSTEEKDIQIEDQVDFETQEETNTEDLTPEVSDFENSEEINSDPETTSTETAEPEAPAEVMDSTPEVPEDQDTPQEVVETPPVTSQETSSPGRVMRFEDFVNNRD